MERIEDKLIDSSRFIADIVTNYIGNEQVLFDEAMLLVLRDEYPLSMRAARVIQLSSYKHLNLVRKHIDDMIDAIQHSKIDGVKRCFLKIFSEKPLKLNEDQIGRLTDMSFTMIENPKEAIAIRAFAIDFLVKTVTLYPDIKNEVLEVLNHFKTENSPGLISKSKKVIAELNKMQFF